MFLRWSRAKSPSEGASSCADAAKGQSKAKSSARTSNGEVGNLDRMISVVRQRALSGMHGAARAQRVHKESLGEMGWKRSYRRDTVVLALPELAKTDGARAWTRSDRSAAQRGASMPFDPVTLTAGQRYENGKPDRLLASIDAQKTSAPPQFPMPHKPDARVS
ncbi:hypothetical protein SBA7_130008 [Candidatus Sulfotelmatobacter sp. SbA7]|nr:hypothetical protein SBA7_130008 [Candidatus Sulfotelmatobacter sp. SbA7]